MSNFHVSIPIRDLMNLNRDECGLSNGGLSVSIPIRDLMNLNPLGSFLFPLD